MLSSISSSVSFDSHRLLRTSNAQRAAFHNLDECQLCNSPFTSTFRRHHCRVCGSSVCNLCSDRHGYTCEKRKRHRICKECARKLTGKNVNKNVDDKEIERDEIEEFKRIDSLPKWLFAFYPLAQFAESKARVTGTPMRYGILHVNVLEAKNLMAADLNLMAENTSDPYCKISFGAVTRKESQTSVVYRTLAPRWNHKQRFDVIYPESTIKVQVWDFDQMDAHDFLGEIELPVSLFKDEKQHDAWYALKPYDGVKRGRIRIRATFRYSKMGELFAHLLEKEPSVDVTPTLDINVLFAYAMELLDQIEPFKRFPSRIVAVLNWDKPLWSIFWLVTFWKLMHNTHLILPSLHLCLLYYIFGKYMERKFERIDDEEYVGDDDNAESMIQVNVRPEPDHTITESKNGTMKDDDDAPTSDEDDSTLDVAYNDEENAKKIADAVEEASLKEKNSLGSKGSMVNMLLAASPGTQESLANLQVACKSGVGGVKTLYKLFDWSEPAKTKGVTYAVMGSMFLFYLIPNNYIFLTAGVLAFFNGTPPFQVFKRYVVGSLAWLTSSATSASALGRSSSFLFARVESNHECSRHVRIRTHNERRNQIHSGEYEEENPEDCCEVGYEIQVALEEQNVRRSGGDFSYSYKFKDTQLCSSPPLVYSRHPLAPLGTEWTLQF